MNTVELPEREILVEYPSGWAELTDEQFGLVMQNWLKVMDGKLNQYEFLVIMAYAFLGIKRLPFHRMKDKRLSREKLETKFANIWQIAETLKWLYREEQTNEGTVVVLDYHELTNRFREVENSGGVKLIGPADGLIDITFGEYRRAWDYFEAYGRWRKHTDLDKFIAILYRPERYNLKQLKKRADFDGCTREPFNPHLTAHYAELMDNIPFWKKNAIWLWFFNCDRFIKEQELELTGRSISFASLFSKKKTDDVETLDENELGLTGLLYMIAESGLFGTVADVDRTNYFDILTTLLMWKQQADKIKKP